MFISIRYKLFGTLLAAVVVVTVSMFFLIHWSLDRGFLNYVNKEETKRLDSLATHLQEAYSEQGGWQFLAGNRRLWRRFLAASTPEGPQQFNPMEDQIPTRVGMNGRRFTRRHAMGQMAKSARHFPEELKHLFEFRVVLMDTKKKVVVGPRKFAPGKMTIIPLIQDSVTIGYLGHIPQKHLFAQHQLRFVQKQKKSFASIALLIAALAALMAFPLASRLLKRMNALAGATHQLASGKFDTRLEVGPSDELGQLTKDLNALALTLEKNEKGRRQWLADISHELRTPLAVLRGEIEALEDGVRQSTTPEALRSLHSEVMRLNRLVDDLFQLSLSDIGALTYQKNRVEMTEILSQAVGLFRPKFIEKNISLTLETSGDHNVCLFADFQRLHQLIDNLLNNSLKYTDPGGTLTISCQSFAGEIKILFLDSFPGVPEADIGRLFERLYRVENSRNRKSGGAGLGLSICKNIVEAHNGTIEAEASPLGGVLIRVTFPVREDA